MIDFKLGTCDKCVIDKVQRKTIREQRKRIGGDVRLFSSFVPTRSVAAPEYEFGKNKNNF